MSFFGFEICIDDGDYYILNLSQDRFLSLESRAIKRVKNIAKDAKFEFIS